MASIFPVNKSQTVNEHESGNRQSLLHVRVFLGFYFEHEVGGDMLLRNDGCFSGAPYCLLHAASSLSCSSPDDDDGGTFFLNVG
jgi:hypothetical protein